MPFRSKAQRRLFYHLANKGKISPNTVQRWEAHTPKTKPLPEKKK